MSMYKLYIFKNGGLKSRGRNIYYAVYDCLECTGMSYDSSISNILRNIKNSSFYSINSTVCNIANNITPPYIEVISCKTYYSIEEIYNDYVEELL